MGSYEIQDLTDRGVGNLFEGKAILDKTFGYVAYGCATCCGYSANPYMYYDPIGVALGFTNNQDVWDIDFCTATRGSVLFAFPSSNWNTGNHAIATASGRVITGMGVGNTTNFTAGTLTIGAVQAKRCPQAPVNPSGPANVGPPAGMLFFSDITTTSSACAITSQNAVKRIIQYQVVDASNNPVGNVPMQENFANLSNSTCNNRLPTPASCAAWDGPSGIFTDSISTNACSPPNPGTCGFSINPDLWQYCRAGSPAQTLGAPTYGVLWQAVYVDGSTAKVKLLTPVPK
jgi:hypothetical protein